MIIPKLEKSLSEELFMAEEGFRVENTHNGRSIEVVNRPYYRYQLAKGGMVADYTNHESVACNFLYGG